MTKITQLPFIFIVKQPLWSFDPDEAPKGRLLSHWLVHSCLYYEMGQSVISDREFDEIAEALKFYWEDESVQSHPHRHLVAMQEGEPLTKSGFYIKFPSTVRGCAEWLLQQYKSKQIK